MFPEQKFKPSNLATAKLILTAIFVFVVCLGMVLGLAGYLARNKSAVNELPQVSLAPTPVSSPMEEILKGKNSSVTNEPEIKLSNIKASLPVNWKIENESDLSVTLVNMDTNISAIMMIEKCESSDDFSCFGSGRYNYTETSNGGIYDLLSTDRVISFGLDLINKDNHRLYIVGVDFGDYQYTVKEFDEIRKILISAFQSIFVSSKDETADWQTYTNEKYGFELFFPFKWKGVREVVSNSAGIETILFELPTSDKNWGQGNGFSPILSLNIESKEEWLKTNSVDDMHPLDVYNNDKYVFEFDTFDKPEDLSEVNPYEFINTFNLINKVSFGSLSAYTKQETDITYMILSEGKKESIIDQIADNYALEGYLFGIFYNPRFSPKGNYLLYSVSGHESNSVYIYDIKNKKIILSSSGGLSFTLDEKYAYVCVDGGMGSMQEGRVYSTSDFKVVYDVFESPILGGEFYTDIQCIYEPKTESIIFNVAHNIIKYSLRDNKDYRMNNESDYKWPLYGE